MGRQTALAHCLSVLKTRYSICSRPNQYSFLSWFNRKKSRKMSVPLSTTSEQEKRPAQRTQSRTHLLNGTPARAARGVTRLSNFRKQTVKLLR